MATKKIAELTTEDFEKLLKDFNAPAEHRTKLSEDEIKMLAERLNKKINVPIISETKEEKILIKIVLRIDRFLYDNLPNEFYDLLRSTSKGISDREARRLIRRLTRLANDKIDIPYIPEIAEHIALKLIISLIINSARKKYNMSKMKEKIDNISEIDDVDDLI